MLYYKLYITEMKKWREHQSIFFHLFIYLFVCLSVHDPSVHFNFVQNKKKQRNEELTFSLRLN